MKKKSAAKNYIYNLIYQLFSIITPLITAPYVSRVLGNAGVGQYSFTYSISSYFILIGSLGFGYYAQREIAKKQGDSFGQSVLFWEIVLARLASVTISSIIYIKLLDFGVYQPEYNTLMWILLINVISTVFDISFLYQGNENFGIIAFRNVVVKSIGIALIFIFVRNENDVWLYALCQAIVLVVSNMSLWIGIHKKITKIPLSSLKPSRHLLPSLRLFVPTVAISVYTMLDRSLIGWMISGTDANGKNFSDIENGNYEQAEKIVKLALTILTSLGIVMLPRNSQVVASGDKEQFVFNINTTIKCIFLIGMPIMFGLASIAKNFSPWFFGGGYEKVPNLILIFSPLIIIIGLSNVLGLQYLLPLGLDKKFTIAIICGALSNLLLNLFLIPLLWSYGAAISSVIAELIVTSIMFAFAHKDLKLRGLLKSNWKYFLSSTVMFAFVFATQFFLKSSILNTVILIVEGIIVYFLSLFVTKDEFFTNLITKKLAKIFKKENKNK